VISVFSIISQGFLGRNFAAGFEGNIHYWTQLKNDLII
jgi:hypothetical protein